MYSRQWVALLLLGFCASCVRGGFGAQSPSDNGSPADSSFADSSLGDGPTQGDQRADASSPCPTNMVSIGSFCVDSRPRLFSNWLEGAATCMDLGFRLCSETEWSSACAQIGTLNITHILGEGEWVMELESDTTARVRGSTDCASSDVQPVETGANSVRCCVDLAPITTAMVELPSLRTFIDGDEDSERTWPRAVSTCMERGKRLCTRAEREEACNISDPLLVRMDDNWEWLAALASSDEATKGGNAGCLEFSQDLAVTRSYPTRCCVGILQATP